MQLVSNAEFRLRIRVVPLLKKPEPVQTLINGHATNAQYGGAPKLLEILTELILR